MIFIFPLEILSFYIALRDGVKVLYVKDSVRAACDTPFNPGKSVVIDKCGTLALNTDFLYY